MATASIDAPSATAFASTHASNQTISPLSPMDSVMNEWMSMTISIFPPPAADSAAYDLERVHESFQALVEHEYRIFLGEFHVDATTGAISIRQSSETAAPSAARAIPFEMVDLSAAVGNDTHRRITTEDALATVSTEFVPARSATQPITVKATLLSDGGLALGLNMSHSMLDGEALFMFIKVWGEFYRGVAPLERTKVTHDRSLLAAKGVGAQLPHPEYRVRPKAAAPSPLTGGAPPGTFPPTRRHVFHLSADQMKRIKAAASSAPSPDDAAVGFVSTVDAVSALFVLLITKARSHGKDVKFATAVNARKRFSPPLPSNFAANAIFYALSTYKAQELETIDAPTLQRAAQRVRQSIAHCNEPFLRDAIEFVASSDNIADLAVAPEFNFGPDVVATSWGGFGTYEAEFASRLSFIGIPDVPDREGTVTILHGFKSLAVVVHLEANAMAQLVKLWDSVPFMA